MLRSSDTYVHEATKIRCTYKPAFSEALVICNGSGRVWSLSGRSALDCFTRSVQWCATILRYTHIKKLSDDVFSDVGQLLSDAKAISVLRVRERHITGILKSTRLHSRRYYEFEAFRYHDVTEKHRRFVTAQIHNEHQEHLQVNEDIYKNTKVKLVSNKCNNRSIKIKAVF